MLVQTAELLPNTPMVQSQTRQIYCGLDCCVTLEVREALEAQRPRADGIYSFERALQGPFLEIMQRGFRVNQSARFEASQRLRQRMGILQLALDRLAGAIWDKGLNPRSYKQLQDFFYTAMKLPEVWLSQKGVKKISTNREALEKLDQYLHAMPVISCILDIREIAKQLDVLEGEIDQDSRHRTSYNIAGTESGRLSSSENAFGTGGNNQNISPELRWVFEADQGFKLCVIDLEQVEARDVGFFCGCLFDDWTFLDACESGDLHTNNAKRIWPELKWTGDPRRDREIADVVFYREFSYRAMAKRGSHLSNYSGTAWTAARSLKVPVFVMEEFQARYIRGRYNHKKLPDIEPAFPCIPRWWQWTATQLQTTRQLTTPFGRQRHFFGRQGDPSVLRDAIAYMPQSTTADRTNLALWRVWKNNPEVQLLAQTHDSITFQALDNSRFDDTVGKVLALMAVELFAPNGRSYIVPGEAKVGWNWGDQIKGAKGAVVGNPEGLVKWKFGQDKRRKLWGFNQQVGGR